MSDGLLTFGSWIQSKARGVWSLMVFATMPIVACKPQNSPLDPRNENASDSSAAAPGERPLVSNAFAYARYLASNLAGSPPSEAWTDHSIKEELIRSASQSGVSPAEILATLAFQPPSGAATEGQTFRRIAQFQAQLEHCAVGSERSARHCCEALAWPMAILPEWNQLSGEQQAALKATAPTTGFLPQAAHKFQATAGGGSSLEAWEKIGSSSSGADAANGENHFKTLGIKAWLAVCHGTVTEQPETWSAFMSSPWMGQTPSLQWTSTLFAKSRAKRGPRRIRTRSDNLVSIAETLKPDTCGIQETEVIVRRADGALNFWVYDASGKRSNRSHFPLPRPSSQGQLTVEKPAPDSCMGCHYDQRKRTFDVLFPSADELRLPSTQSLAILCRRDGERVAEDPHH